MDKGQQTDVRIRLLSCSVYIGLNRTSRHAVNHAVSPRRTTVREISLNVARIVHHHPDGLWRCGYLERYCEGQVARFTGSREGMACNRTWNRNAIGFQPYCNSSRNGCPGCNFNRGMKCSFIDTGLVDDDISGTGLV